MQVCQRGRKRGEKELNLSGQAQIQMRSVDFLPLCLTQINVQNMFENILNFAIFQAAGHEKSLSLSL